MPLAKRLVRRNIYRLPFMAALSSRLFVLGKLHSSHKTVPQNYSFPTRSRFQVLSGEKPRVNFLFTLPETRYVRFIVPMNSLLFALLLVPSDAPPASGAQAIGRASVRIVSAEIIRFGENFRLDNAASTEKKSKPPVMRYQSKRTKAGQPEMQLVEFY